MGKLVTSFPFLPFPLPSAIIEAEYERSNLNHPSSPSFTMAESFTTYLQTALMLPAVPRQAAESYRQNLAALCASVDQALLARPDLGPLIGNNQPQVMYDNHQHHGAFMATVFAIGGYELLARTVPWVYRSYHAHGFDYDYFLHELAAWQEAVRATLPEPLQSQILAIYDWLLHHHQETIALSLQPPDEAAPVGESWLHDKERFRLGLLEGDHRGCLEIARQYCGDGQDLQGLYLYIIQPVMYEIGAMWERAEISVAQEHLASAIVSRIMATIGADLPLGGNSRGKAVITAAPNEYHEIGAWMISDILEQDGWQVRYLGADTPGADLLQLLDSYLPDVLAISITMPFNLQIVQELITTIRNNSLQRKLKIIVGGRLFLENPELSEQLGADGYASNINEARSLARTLAP